MKRKSACLGTPSPTGCAKLLAFASTRNLLPFFLLLWSSAGAKASFSYRVGDNAVTITGYTGPGGSITIPAAIDGLPVKRIGDVAFDGNISITNITIPNGVEDVGQGAFQGCLRLGTVSLPGSVTNIGLNAFNNCRSLAGIEIPRSVATIGLEAFSECPNLTSIAVEPGNQNYSSVGGVLFDKGRTELVQYPEKKGGSYTIPNTVTKVGGAAFLGCSNLTSVTIPTNVNSIGLQAFSGCTGLTSLEIPAGITDIASSLFAGCAGLTNLTLPESVTTIGYGAFAGCSELTRMVMPSRLTDLESMAFSHCASLTNVMLPDSVVVPENVTNIGDHAFSECTSLRYITLPSKLMSIGQETVYDCYSLKGIFIHGDAPSLGVFAPVLYYAGNATIYYLPGTSGWGATLSDVPTVLWNPVLRADKSSFRRGDKGFDIYVTGTADIPIVVMACTNLMKPRWVAIESCSMTNGAITFRDADGTTNIARFYGIRVP